VFSGTIDFMETYEEQMEALCRDIVMHHLLNSGMNAHQALQEYQSNPALRRSVEGLASIHVRKMQHREDAPAVSVSQIRGATPLGNGQYRITSPNRSAITGRFNKS
jgi:hypothetical protein